MSVYDDVGGTLPVTGAAVLIEDEVPKSEYLGCVPIGTGTSTAGLTLEPFLTVSPISNEVT